MNVATVPLEQDRGREGYIPPATISARDLHELITWSGRQAKESAQLSLLDRPEVSEKVFLAGDAKLLRSRCVSIVGTREVSPEGWRRASRLARELSAKGVVVVSGLARGVDTAALSGAISVGGKVVAVIGTPLDKAYPAENADLQQEIYREHLLISPFRSGEKVFRSNFPKRNRVMAALSDASVIIEASDTSGTLHQADACQRLGRWLFILRSVAENPEVTWPRRFLAGRNTAVIDSTADILAKLGA